MFVVTVFSCFERLLGFVYRIYLSRNLGSEGLGLYQVALSVVGLIMTLTSSGIPITVSRIMTKHSAENRGELGFSTVTGGILLSLVLSVPVVTLIFFFPKAFSFLFADERCYTILKIMLPGIVITSVYAVIRGYFWGKKMFFTYSLVEFMEEAVMLVAGIIFISKATDTQSGITGAGNAVLISYIFSFITATILYFIRGGKIASPKGELKPLISSATPITLMRTATSLINTLIAIILPLRLVHSGLSQSVAMAGFGELSGMSIPLIYIPSTIIGSIALVLVPELSDNFYRHSEITLKNNVEKAVKCSVFISCLIIPVFLSLGTELGVLVYDNFNAGLYVQRACIIMLPMSISMITTSMLNSLNLEKKTLKYYLIGALFLVFSIYFLPKLIGVYSLVVGLLVSYAITSFCNLRLIKRTCKRPPEFSFYIAVSTMLIIPSALFGYLLKGILLKFIPLPLTVLAVSILTVIFIYLLFKIFNLFSLREIIFK
ncbi:MAG: oligosaccharide flippase family protein [Clostridia bacterium]|nr:oligosaccharide flippase family protein [Clostridia bacterium]